ncbi:hypothetical protein ULMS_27460 [Patiriisocius marinistellae]|uniref:Secretion system C-terminal sorting domain-containing protein n=1 Tax=Patiriisocius marinistellae TaxID=2494560 RepID=A0A5J4G0J2_9FLAO|nr:T9SS type A sorting domain-containing protein [Patiriisocius marinistellae]GEQ87238.1 hypothetical protein ULMS_27460 [Patiriisocius marinistellae]
MLKFIFTTALVFSSLLSFGQTEIKTMFYNLLEFPEALPQNREAILKDILNEYNPDVFMICELQSQEGADLILNSSLNDEDSDFAAAPYFENQSSGADLQQLLFYRKNMFTLENTAIITTPVRDINRYDLKLSTLDGDTDPVIINTYVTHLKSSQGSANQTLRLEMVQEFTEDIESLDPNAFVLFAGDFNLYTSTEPAYGALLNPTNNVVMVDPIDTPGSWNNNEDFAGIHTQSTRISSSGFGAGAGGGLDDRFDFILMSQSMQTNPTLRYVEGTYKSFGNNANCYNNRIDAFECDGEFSLQLRSSLYNMSDHLPVVMSLETNKEIVILNTPVNEVATNFILKSTIVSEILEIETLGDTDITFSIYNTLGQKITETSNKNQTTTVINIAHLPQGVYYLTNNQSSTQTIKFLKTF